MEWESISKFLIDNSVLIGIVIAIAAFATGVLKWLLGAIVNIWKFLFGKKSIATNQGKPASDKTAEVLVKKLLKEQKKRLRAEQIAGETEQEADALRKTIEALQQQHGSERDEALDALAQGDTAKAEELFTNIAKEREGAGTTAYKEAAQAFRHLGALAFLHDTNKALTAYQKATLLDPDNADGWNELGQLQMRLGNLDAAIIFYNKVLSLGNRAADKTVIAVATGNLGNVHQIRGDLDKAEEMHNRSLEISRELGRKEGMANDYGNLGNVHRIRGDLDKAEDMYNRSLEINRELGRKEGMANQYGNLGTIHQTRGDLDKAEEMYNRSLEIELELGRKEGMASDYGNLGDLHQIRGDLDKAEEMYNRSLEINRELGSKEGMANDYGNLGNLHKTRGDLDKACESWRQSRDLFEELGAGHMVEKVEGWMKDAGCD